MAPVKSPEKEARKTAMAKTGSKLASVGLCLAALLLCHAPASAKNSPTCGTRSALKLLDKRPDKELMQDVVFNWRPSA